jgi:hypothetical protein
MEVTRTKIKLFDGVTSTEEGLELLENKVNEWLAQNAEIKVKHVSSTSSQNPNGGYKAIVAILYRAKEEIETEEEKLRKQGLAEIGKAFEEATREIVTEYKEKQRAS